MFARGLIERGASGAIVNTSSQAAQRCLPHHSVYCTSKAAVDQLTRSLAYELGPHKVRLLPHILLLLLLLHPPVLLYITHSILYDATAFVSLPSQRTVGMLVLLLYSL